MMTSPFPQNFNEWKYCITVECGITLSASFIAQRLLVWKDENHEETRRFRQRFGDNYWRSVIGWFTQAEEEFANGTSDSIGASNAKGLQVGSLTEARLQPPNKTRGCQILFLAPALPSGARRPNLTLQAPGG